MRKFYAIGLILTLSFALIGCSISDNTANNSKIIYENKEYGFTFSLPSSWNGYKILKNSWEGTKFENQKTESGPILFIRHPKWTEKKSTTRYSRYDFHT